MIDDDTIGNPGWVLRSADSLRKPMTDAALIARFGFLDIGEQKEGAFARGDPDRRFGCRARFAELARIERRPRDGQLGLDIVHLELAEAAGAIQAVMG